MMYHGLINGHYHGKPWCIMYHKDGISVMVNNGVSWSDKWTLSW